MMNECRNRCKNVNNEGTYLTSYRNNVDLSFIYYITKVIFSDKNALTKAGDKNGC